MSNKQTSDDDLATRLQTMLDRLMSYPLLSGEEEMDLMEAINIVEDN